VTSLDAETGGFILILELYEWLIEYRVQMSQRDRLMLQVIWRSFFGCCTMDSSNPVAGRGGR
jgi:hypothetical protein